LAGKPIRTRETLYRIFARNPTPGFSTLFREARYNISHPCAGGTQIHHTRQARRFGATRERALCRGLMTGFGLIPWRPVIEKVSSISDISENLRHVGAHLLISTVTAADCFVTAMFLHTFPV
jgi:hypothetical protein